VIEVLMEKALIRKAVLAHGKAFKICRFCDWCVAKLS